MRDLHFAIIGGAGTMGEALINGLISSGEVSRDNIVATARHEASAQRLLLNSITATTDNGDAVSGADVVIFAVGPENIEEVIRETKDRLTSEQLVISIVTGVSTARIEELIGAPVPVIRANPNIAALVSESATAICGGHHAKGSHMQTARRLFETVGIVAILDEHHMNASTGLGGCGPAFVFKIIESMSEGGVKMGIPREASRNIAAQVVKGAAEMVLKTGKHPAALKDEVTTPGGCTIAGIAKLQERGIAIALIDAVETSSRRASELFK